MDVDLQNKPDENLHRLRRNMRQTLVDARGKGRPQSNLTDDSFVALVDEIQAITAELTKRQETRGRLERAAEERMAVCPECGRKGE